MSSSPNKLPFLPGYRQETQPKANYHKAHMFEVHNGVRVDLAREQVPAASFTQQSTVILSPSQQFKQTQESKTADPLDKTSSLSRLPAWVAYDRKVLRFTGWFRESVHSSAVETWRIRRMLLYFYLEDDSIHIAEPKVENSGLPQGVFVKRHRIPKAQTNHFFQVSDLKIGAELPIYGRVFRITDADAFTRAFYAKNGMELGAYEPTPSDPFTDKANAASERLAQNSGGAVSKHNKTMHPHKQYMEASLGKPIHAGIDATRQFLTNDRKVLRFYAQWDDSTLYGEKKPYIVHYYLADDTVEILEVQQPNSGRDVFPVLLKRGKLPVNWTEATPDVSKIGVLKDEMYSRYVALTDLKVGGHLNVFGRNLFLCGADEFTIEYYCRNYGMTPKDFPRINMKDAEDEVLKLTPPPYNGFGNLEDSLGSYLYLNPQIPKHDWKKLIEQDGKMLRYLARFTPHPSQTQHDAERRFIVTYYLAHDLLSVFEKFERNSGFLGGKFLERTRAKNADGEFYAPEHLYPGAHITLNTYKFDLLDVDDFTQQYMMEHEDLYRSKTMLPKDERAQLAATQKRQ